MNQVISNSADFHFLSFWDWEFPNWPFLSKASACQTHNLNPGVLLLWREVQLYYLWSSNETSPISITLEAHKVKNEQTGQSCNQWKFCWTFLTLWGFWSTITYGPRPLCKFGGTLKSNTYWNKITFRHIILSKHPKVSETIFYPKEVNNYF